MSYIGGKVDMLADSVPTDDDHTEAGERHIRQYIQPGHEMPLVRRMFGVLLALAPDLTSISPELAQVQAIARTRMPNPQRLAALALAARVYAEADDIVAQGEMDAAALTAALAHEAADARLALLAVSIDDPDPDAYAKDVEERNAALEVLNAAGTDILALVEWRAAQKAALAAPEAPEVQP